LENRKKVETNSPRNALKKKNKVVEGRASGSRVKGEQESMEARAKKLMKGKVEPFSMPIVVHRYHR
jgi:hypothetical protein